MKRFADLSSIKQNQTKKQICKLLFDGNGYKKIRRLFANQGIKLQLSTLSYWCTTNTTRLRKNSFNANPSKELAYFIGVMFGDGCATMDANNHDYCLKLATIDNEFGTKFCYCVSKLLKKEKIYPLHRCKEIFAASVRSKELYEFVKEIKEDFKKVKPFIELFPAEFIQGIADSEGHPSIVAKNSFTIKVAIANSANLELLEYCEFLLKNVFEIKTKLRLTKKIGMVDSILEGRIIKRTKNVYLLETTNFKSTKKYFSKIGFSIKRKQEKLKDGICILEKFSPKKRHFEWKKLYFKKGKQWKKLELRPLRNLNPRRTRDRGES